MEDSPTVRGIRAFGSVVVMVGLYILIRYALFDWHQMKAWPLVLFVASLAVIVVSAFIASWRISLLCCVGYLAGFFAGWLFQADGTDAGGGKTNSLWIIWTLVYLLAVLLGMLWERQHNKKLSDKA
ncbi:MAG: hypothetical protein FWH40_01790 [Coriobacteriia bacterium]|nr:hypothetical protein [Coriobacteriia bacterium]